MRVLAGICAAGSSTRMGFDKLAAPLPTATPLKGDTCLTRACAASSHLDQHVILPPQDHPYYSARKALIGPLPAQSVSGGFSESLKALARAALGYDGLLVQLADMPLIRPAHVEAICTAFEAEAGLAIIRAVTDTGRQGHPVLFPAACLPAFEDLTGDHGAQEIVARFGVTPLEIAGDAAIRDLDSPEDWAAFVAD